MDDRKRKATADSLQVIIDEFNEKFNSWMEGSSCRANLGWVYGKDSDSIKNLEIQAIDLEVYRKPAPEYLSMQQGVSMDRTAGLAKK